MHRERLVIVGNGMASAAPARAARRERAPGRFDVTVVGAEPRAGLQPGAPVLAAGGEDVDGERLPVPRSGPGALRQGVRLIDRRRRDRHRSRRSATVVVGELTTLPFDRLVLATGSARRSGCRGPGWICPASSPSATSPTWRRSALRRRRGARAVVIGGGLARDRGRLRARAARRARSRSSMLMDRLMERQLDRRAAVAHASAAIEAKGIRVAARGGHGRDRRRRSRGRRTPRGRARARRPISSSSRSACGLAAELAKRAGLAGASAASSSMTRSRPRRPASTPSANAPSTAAPHTASSSPRYEQANVLARAARAARMRAMPAASLLRASEGLGRAACSRPATRRGRGGGGADHLLGPGDGHLPQAHDRDGRLVGAVLVRRYRRGGLWYSTSSAPAPVPCHPRRPHVRPRLRGLPNRRGGLPPEPMSGFNAEQKRYLEGFVSGIRPCGPPVRALRPAAGRPAEPIGPDAIHVKAQDSDGRGRRQARRAGEVEARAEHPFDALCAARGRGRGRTASRSPRTISAGATTACSTSAPTQDSFMCRLRIPNGILNALAVRRPRRPRRALRRRLCPCDDPRQPSDPRDRGRERGRHARRHPGSRAVRARRRRRQHPQRHRVADGGNRRAGADRYAAACPRAGTSTSSTTASLYGLPRKFNVAFDGGGVVPVLEETNDIGFQAVEVREGAASSRASGCASCSAASPAIATSPGTPESWCAPKDCVAVADAIVRVFIENGDRTNRSKARLKYVLDCLGLRQVSDGRRGEARPARSRASPPATSRRARATDRFAHLGVHPQKQAGLNWVGVVLPVGKLTTEQMREARRDRARMRRRRPSA